MILFVPRRGGPTLYDRVDTDYDDLDAALARAEAHQRVIESDFAEVSDLLRQSIKTLKEVKNGKK